MYRKFEAIMHEKGLNPCKVSKMTGIARSTLSDWKTGKSVPKVDKLQKIADVLGCNLTDLL